MMNLVFAHVAGDFLIQNDWMAREKKYSSFVCLVHVLTYLIPFVILNVSWLALLLIGAQHFIQDRTNVIKWLLDNTGKSDFAQPPLAPWSIIVVDNFFHLGWIYVVMVSL